MNIYKKLFWLIYLATGIVKLNSLSAAQIEQKRAKTMNYKEAESLREIYSDKLLNLIKAKNKQGINDLLKEMRTFGKEKFESIFIEIQQKYGKQLFAFIENKNDTKTAELVNMISFYNAGPLLKRVVNMPGRFFGLPDYALPFAVKLFCESIFACDCPVEQDAQKLLNIINILEKAEADVNLGIEVPGDFYTSTSLDLLLNKDLELLPKKWKAECLNLIQRLVDRGADFGGNNMFDTMIENETTCSMEKKTAIEVVKKYDSETYREILAIFETAANKKAPDSK